LSGFRRLIYSRRG